MVRVSALNETAPDSAYSHESRKDRPLSKTIIDAACSSPATAKSEIKIEGFDISMICPDPRFLELLEKAAKLLADLLTKNNVCPSHGVLHALRVARHAARALRHCTWKKSDKQYLAVILAALLHDADDRKFFPNNANYDNARRIIHEIGLETDVETSIIEMIKVISTSSNGNSIPTTAIDEPWILYPRYADRIEAIGWTGIVRCWEYTLSSGVPLYTDATPRADDEKKVAAVATSARFEAYKGKSDSMLDHYLDKLLHIGNFRSGNAYLDGMTRRRNGPLVEVVTIFGKLGHLPDDLFARARAEAEKEATDDEA